ncbi:MAG: hypothetical protein ACYTGZ_12390 [Planctomycetota bacterium]|jgi:hypothetical protein
MKSAAIPTIAASLALGGVLLLFFREYDAAPDIIRQEERSDDSEVRIAELEFRIKQLERQVETLSSYEPPTPERALASPVDAGETRKREPDPRDKKPEQDRTERRRERTNTRLARLVADGKVGKLTDEQVRKVTESFEEARKKAAEAIADVRENPANEGLEREARIALMRTAMDEVRTEFENAIAAYMPSSDAQVIAKELLSAQGGRRGGGARGTRGGNRGRRNR